LAEIELMRKREQVAELRRWLPPGPRRPTQLADGDLPVHEVRLNELFTGHYRSPFAYHLMFGKKQTDPCPMCTMRIDGKDRTADRQAGE
jgi:predicted dithiol-disulfide oxidoreductase (DUF899 family)